MSIPQFVIDAIARAKSAEIAAGKADHSYLRGYGNAKRDILIELEKVYIQLTAPHEHQWIDITTISDLANKIQRHICGCGMEKKTPL